jgi:hypothetical protein
MPHLEPLAVYYLSLMSKEVLSLLALLVEKNKY